MIANGVSGSTGSEIEVNARGTLTGMTLRGFVQSAGLMSVSSLANVIRALITAKVLAVTPGPSSMGILAQLLNFSGFLMTVVPLGLTTGVAKMIAEARGSEDRINLIVCTSTALALGSGLVAATLISPLAYPVSNLLTGSGAYGPLVIVLLGTMPLSNIAGVLSYVLQGLLEIRRLTWVNASVAAGTLVLTVPAAYEYGLSGVVWAILGSSILYAVAFLVAVRSTYLARGWKLLHFKFSRASATSLLGYGGIMLIGGIGMLGSVLVVRTLVIRELGNYDNGIYQVAYGLSSQYMAVFMAWMAAYVFPKIAAEQSSARISSLLNFGLTVNLYLMVPLLVAITALREPVIRLLFSASFVPVAPLVPIQVFGDYLKVLGWSFGIVLFARGRTRAHLVAVLTQAVVWVAVTAALLPVVGLAAVIVGYTVSYLTWPAMMYLMARRWFNVRISGESAALAALGVLLLSGAAMLPWTIGTLLALVMPAILLLRRRHQLRRAL